MTTEQYRGHLERENLRLQAELREVREKFAAYVEQVHTLLFNGWTPSDGSWDATMTKPVADIVRKRKAEREGT